MKVPIEVDEKNYVFSGQLDAVLARYGAQNQVIENKEDHTKFIWVA